MGDWQYYMDLHLGFLRDWATDLYVLPWYHKSRGTRIEIETAKEHLIPICFNIEKLIEAGPDMDLKDHWVHKFP